MKHFLVTIVSCAALTLPAFADEQTVTMDIEKMSCVTCPLTVRLAMQRVDGVQDVAVDFDSKTAVVTFDDDKTTAIEVAQASTDVGYPATPVKE
jgi:periplasmic mercuric ion binding protein